MTLAEARKLVSLAHRQRILPPHAPAGIRRASFAAVRSGFHVPRLDVLASTPSRIDPFVKYTLGAPEGGAVEAVRIPLERPGRYSVCISSQVGCALGCRFCATGQLGLSRNLAAWEMVEQVRVVRDDLPSGGRLHGVVFQGMGEPLANVAQVIQAIRVLFEPCAMAIDARCITVCTAGLPAGILSLAREVPNVRLALSVGSARPHVRESIMPISRTHSLEHVLDAAGEHAERTGHSPLWAYTLLSGVNTTRQDASALAERFHSFVERYRVRPRLTLVAYNSIDRTGGDPYTRATCEEEQAFWAWLAEDGVRAKRRYSGGCDVGAACGQLAARLNG